jgi:hypothetical protein
VTAAAANQAVAMRSRLNWRIDSHMEFPFIAIRLDNPLEASASRFEYDARLIG